MFTGSKSLYRLKYAQIDMPLNLSGTYRNHLLKGCSFKCIHLKNCKCIEYFIFAKETYFLNRPQEFNVIFNDSPILTFHHMVIKHIFYMWFNCRDLRIIVNW